MKIKLKLIFIPTNSMLAVLRAYYQLLNSIISSIKANLPPAAKAPHCWDNSKGYQMNGNYNHPDDRFRMADSGWRIPDGGFRMADF